MLVENGAGGGGGSGRESEWRAVEAAVAHAALHLNARQDLLPLARLAMRTVPMRVDERLPAGTRNASGGRSSLAQSSRTGAVAITRSIHQRRMHSLISTSYVFPFIKKITVL